MSPSTEVIEVETLADAKSPESAFAEYVQKYQVLKTTAETLTVTDEADTAGMKLARETRLTLRDIRIDAEKTRKSLKEESLKRGQRIDAAAKKVTAIIEPLEDRLLEQEQFAERAAEARRKRLQDDRETAMRPYGDRQYGIMTPMINNLALCTEEEFQHLLSNARELHEGRLAREKAITEAAAAEEARRAAEAAAIRAENDRLRAERERMAAEHAVSIATAAQAARAEKEAREIAEARIRGLEAEAENKRQAEEIKAARAAAGPDREKLLAYAEALRAVPVPEFNTPMPAVKALVANLCAQLAVLLDAPAGEAVGDDY